MLFVPALRWDRRCHSALSVAGIGFDSDVRFFLRKRVLQRLVFEHLDEFPIDQSFLDEEDDFAKLSLEDVLLLARGRGIKVEVRKRQRAIRTLLRHFLWYLQQRADFQER